MKNIMITGAAGNLGAAVTEAFLAAGYQVFATVIPHEQAAFSTRFPQVKSFTVDLTDEAATQALVANIAAKHPIHAAVMLVGGFAMGGIAETGKAELQKMYSLNFETAYFVARPIFAQMAKQGTGGHLLLIGAQPALEPAAGKGLVAYALSKGLLFHLAELLNESGKEHNIHCSVLAPSIIDTPPNRAAMPEADFGKWVTPAQIAEIIVFACSNAGAALQSPIWKAYGGL